LSRFKSCAKEAILEDRQTIRTRDTDLRWNCRDW
jgi:hypothetical protein